MFLKSQSVSKDHVAVAAYAAGKIFFQNCKAVGVNTRRNLATDDWFCLTLSQ